MGFPCAKHKILLQCRLNFTHKGTKMFHICFAADEKYIKYAAVLMTSIVKSVDTSKQFEDFFKTSVCKNARYKGGGGQTFA